MDRLERVAIQHQEIRSQPRLQPSAILETEDVRRVRGDVWQQLLEGEAVTPHAIPDLVEHAVRAGAVRVGGEGQAVERTAILEHRQ
jgi:hypothetical protein